MKRSYPVTSKRRELNRNKNYSNLKLVMDASIHIGSIDTELSKSGSHDVKDILKKSLKSPGVLALSAVTVLFLIVVTMEFGLGLGVKSFHLMVDSLHNVLNIIALAFSLVSTVVARVPKGERFTYGYSRLEIIAAFANCCFLIFLSLFLVFRGIHNSLESLNEEGGHNHDASSQRFDLLILFNAIRFVVNAVGIFALYKFSSLYPNLNQTFLTKLWNKFNVIKNKKDDQNTADSFSRQISSHHVNFHSVYIHFVIGLLVNGTFICIHCIEFLHETNFEILFAIIQLIYTIIKTKPIFFLTTDILLQALPQSHESEIDRLLMDLNRIKGLSKVNSSRYWALGPNHHVIHLDLTLDEQICKAYVEEEAQRILQGYFAEILIHSTFLAK